MQHQAGPATSRSQLTEGVDPEHIAALEGSGARRPISCTERQPKIRPASAVGRGNARCSGEPTIDSGASTWLARPARFYLLRLGRLLHGYSHDLGPFCGWTG